MKKLFTSLLAIVLMALFLPANVDADGASWYATTTWKFRKSIIISSTITDSTMTDFPLLVYTATDASLASNAQADGDDILFTSSNGQTKINHEIEYYNSSTGELVAWIQIASLPNTSNTEIYMYYGNPAASNQQNITSTWSATYKAVYHFAETAGDYLDSTGNNEDCATISVTSRTAAGKYRYAPDFVPASTNGIGCTVVSTLGDVTQMAWVFLDSGSALRPIIQHAALGELEAQNVAYGLETDNTVNNNLWQQWEHGAGVNDTNTSTAAVATGAWAHVAAVRDATGNTVTWYLNGAATGSASSYTNDPTGGGSGLLYIGKRISSGQYWDGRIDEIRIYHSIQSADYIKATYQNQNAPGTYLTFNGQTTNSSTTFFGTNF